MFITEKDLKTAIYPEILKIISRDRTILKTACEEAAAEVASYLSARYDTTAIFSAKGRARDKTIIRLCKVIALYNIHTAGNPDKIPDIRVKQYDDAIRFLNGVQSEKLNIPGLPRPASGTHDYIKFGGNRKRKNTL